MTPPTRDDLIRAMAEARAKRHECNSDCLGIPSLCPCYIDAECNLTAIEAAGCRVVPEEATTEMRGFPYAPEAGG